MCALFDATSHAWQEDVKRLEEELKAAKEQLEETEGTSTTQGNDLARLKAQIEALEGGKQELEDKVTKEKGLVSELKQEVEDLKDELGRRDGSDRELQRQLDRALEELDMLENTVVPKLEADLVAETQKCQEKITRVEANADSRVHTAEAATTEVETERDALKTNLKAAEREISSLSGLVADLEGKVEDMEKALEVEKTKAHGEGVNAGLMKMMQMINNDFSKLFTFKLSAEPREFTGHILNPNPDVKLDAGGQEAMAELQTSFDSVNEEILKLLREIDRLLNIPDKNKLPVAWEYEQSPMSNKFIRLPPDISNRLEMAQAEGQEQIPETMKPAFSPDQSKQFVMYVNGRIMVDMESGSPYTLRRRQPVVAYLTIGIGLSLYKTDKNGEKIED